MPIALTTKWYAGSTKWTAVTAWSAAEAVTVGTLRRQLAAPAIASERVFVCAVAGTTGGAEPSWTLTARGSTNDNGVIWYECTGSPSVNGDSTNTYSWTGAAKNASPTAGQIIKRDSGASYQICTTAGTCGNGAEPAFSDTAGTTTADGTAVWTSLGVVGNFAPYASPHATIQAAAASTWMASGDIVYVSNNHAQTAAAATAATANGTNSAYMHFICVDDAVAPPVSLATTASVTTTGANAISIGGFPYLYGITFNSGTGANTVLLTASATGLYAENCTFKTLATNSACHIQTGTSLGAQTYVNCNFVFSNAGSSINFNGGRLTFINMTPAATGTVPTSLFNVLSGSNGANVMVRDSDLSNINTNLWRADGSNAGTLLTITNCRLNAAVTPANGTTQIIGNMILNMDNCDSGATNYRFAMVNAQAIMTSNASVYNNAGASDGTARTSWQVVTPATRVSDAQPFMSKTFYDWIDTTGVSKTATVEIAGASALTNADIWLELEYPSSAASPLGSIVTNKVASILSTPANHPTSAAAWAGAPASTQYLQVSFTPQSKGVIKARVYVTKISTTVYIDPKITVA